MEKALPLLEKLAEKLGTTVEHLWAVLLNQVRVEIVLHQYYIAASFAMYGLALAFGVWAIYLNKKDSDYLPAPIIALIALLVAGVSIHIDSLIVLQTLQNNPEFWALQEVLKHI